MRTKRFSCRLSFKQNESLKTQNIALKDETKTQRNSVDQLLNMQGISWVDSTASSLLPMQFRAAVHLSAPAVGESL